MPATRACADLSCLTVRSVFATAGSVSDATPRRALHVQGELDIATAPRLRVLLDEAASGCSEVDLDLSGLAFCDVVGLTAIEDAQRRLSAQGCVLILRGAARQCCISSSASHASISAVKPPLMTPLWLAEPVGDCRRPSLALLSRGVSNGLAASRSGRGR